MPGDGRRSFSNSADLSAALDPRQQIENVLRRDHRRIRKLTTLTVVLWIIAGALPPLFTAFYMTLIYPKMQGVLEEIVLQQHKVDSEVVARSAQVVLAVSSKVTLAVAIGSMTA